MSVVDSIMQEHRSVFDRAREVVHAACLNPDEYRTLVRHIAIAISDAEIRGIQNCKALIRAQLGRNIFDAQGAEP